MNKETQNSKLKTQNSEGQKVALEQTLHSSLWRNDRLHEPDTYHPGSTT